MSIEINKAFVQQFKDNLRHLAQQKGSRLQSTVMSETVVGKSHHFERLGAVVAQKRTSRHADTPQIDTPHSRRRVSLDDYEWADLIDNQDKVRMLISPESDYAMAGSNALGRTMDDVILEAATGNSTSMDASDSSSSIALPAGQTVDEDFGTGSDTNLTLEKIIEAKRILDANDVDPADRRYLVHNSSALANLLNDSTITSSDFNTIKALVNGELNSYVGFEFVRSERLRGTADGTDADPVQCVAYAKSGLGLAMGEDIKVRISERDDKSYATQVYASMTIGAVRVEEEKVVKVECVQSYSGS